MYLQNQIFTKFRKVLPISGSGSHSDPIVLHHAADLPNYKLLESEVINYLGELFFFDYHLISKTVENGDDGAKVIDRFDLACQCRLTFSQFIRPYYFDITDFVRHDLTV